MAELGSQHSVTSGTSLSYPATRGLLLRASPFQKSVSWPGNIWRGWAGGGGGSSRQAKHAERRQRPWDTPWTHPRQIKILSLWSPGAPARGRESQLSQNKTLCDSWPCSLCWVDQLWKCPRAVRQELTMVLFWDCGRFLSPLIKILNVQCWAISLYNEKNIKLYFKNIY